VGSHEEYQVLYEQSVADPQSFWLKESESLQWMKKPTKALEYEFSTPRIRWFEDGFLNATENCLDRHVQNGDGDRVAIIWEGDNPNDDRKIRYATLLKDVCRFAQVLKAKGVKKGDRVCIYMPMVPELAVAMLACARIGAIHSIVFAGFSSNRLRDRIENAQAKVLITADEGVRGGKAIP
jgi:acetyl-CoA synthetase